MIRRGEIYWVNFRGAVGAEIGKTRPAVVVSSDDHNKFMGTITVVPMSSAQREARPQEVAVPADSLGDGRPSRIAAHQLHSVDKSRVGKKFGALPAKLMRALEASLLEHLGIEV